MERGTIPLKLKTISILSLTLILTLFVIYLKDHPELGKKIYSPEMIQVKISGPVKNPGIYLLESGSTGLDLVEKAGGYLPEAANSFKANDLDQLLVDGQAVDLGKR